jgi:uncharacterized SAM-binding protein YcdF (DUF218 family)
MFILKKIIGSLVTFPGIIIIFLMVSGLYGFKKKIKILQLNFIAGVIIYLLSISPVSNFLTGIIEENYFYDGRESVDVIILLGGGVIEGVSDFSGKSIPSPDMLFRIVDAARLYSRYKLPVVVSGGSAGCEKKESEIAGRFLGDLGVPENKIIPEGESRDTVENALNVKKIFLSKGYKKGLLITSGYHIKRAKYIFEKTGLEVIPYSSGLLSEQKECLAIFDFLPHVGSFRDSAVALKEFVGMAFYYLKYYFK